MISPLSFLLWGFIAGLYFSIIGAIKDSPYEGFKIFSFVRSILLGLLCGFVVWRFFFYFPQTNINFAFLLFFVCVGLERQFTEIYKQFFRVESQEKYKIPSYVTVRAKIVENRFFRILIGLGLIIVFFSFLFWLRSFLITSNFHEALKIFIASSVGGLYVSLLGAYKDAPFEGFDKIKLWRSEIIAVLFGLLFAPLVNDYIVLGYASIGAERSLVEFYKTFISRKKPGKFR